MYPPTVTEDSAILQDESTDVSNEELDAQEEARKEAELLEEDLDKAVTELMKKAEGEDLDLRFNLVNIWKRNTYYFNNIQNIFLDPVARDYKTLNVVLDDLVKNGYNLDIKNINVYRAWAESIIAALSVEVPAVEFSPDDADNPNDIETAAAMEKIGIIVSKHNAASLMLIKALTLLYNNGTIFGHNTYKSDPKYGIVSKPGKTEQKSKPVSDIRCAGCNTLIDSNVEDQLAPQQQPYSCPECGTTAPPNVISKLMYFDEVVEWEDTPKGRSEFDIYSGVNVKASLYARKQADLGYLILRLEDDIAKYKTEYDNLDLEDKATGDLQIYERWGRIPIEYNGGLPPNIATCRYGYFRPWYYNRLGEEDAALLKEHFPSGLKAVMIGDTVVEKESNSLDDEWTVSFDPRADFIHAEPAGNAVIPIQDAENDIFNLGLQSIEFGIPETFVHPKTVGLSKYSKQQASPGMLSPAMPYAPDKTIADGFHTVKTATLSGEYSSFDQSLQSKGQLVSAATPSLYGGQALAGSKTADEYRQSRAQALQRVQIPWRTIKVFWSSLIFKSATLYAKNLLEDEKFSEKKNGSFINVWIHKSALSGKVGQVDPDMNETLPSSWAQKRDFITKMIETKDPMVGTILLHPNNTELLKKYAAIPELYIPGENDRNKQWTEFYTMVAGGQAAVDPVVDDHGIHMAVLKNILVSPVGMNLDPEVYNSCIEHYKQHEMAQLAKTQEASGLTPPGVNAETAANSVQG